MAEATDVYARNCLKSAHAQSATEHTFKKLAQHAAWQEEKKSTCVLAALMFQTACASASASDASMLSANLLWLAALTLLTAAACASASASCAALKGTCCPLH